MTPAAAIRRHKTGSLAQKEPDRRAGGADGLSIALALDTAAAMAIAALLLLCEARSGPKSLT